MANFATKAARWATRVAGAVKRSPDVMRLAMALQMPGIDTRVWILHGTVGTWTSNGVFTPADADPSQPEATQAVWAEPAGCFVDVELETGQRVTARYNGAISGRFGMIMAPVFAGDEVIVYIPGGNLNHPAIHCHLSGINPVAQLPTDWSNDRVLIKATVPLEIDAPAIKLTSANITLNGRPVVPSAKPV